MKRAEYLLTEEGFPIGEQRSRDVPPELLEEVFELNMMLEELRSGDESARPQLEIGERQLFESARGNRQGTGEPVREVRCSGSGKRDGEAGAATRFEAF